MVKNVLSKLKFETSDERIIKHPGLLAVAGLHTHYEYPQEVTKHLPAYTSNNCFEKSRHHLCQTLSRAAGGVGINDTKEVSNDLQLGKLLFPKKARKYQAKKDRIKEQIRNQTEGDREADKVVEGEDEEIEVTPGEVGEGYFPKPSTMSDFYQECTGRDGHRLRRKNREVAYQMISERGERKLYLDFDPKLHKSTNEQAKKTREGYRGYHPFYVTAPEQKLCMGHLFRKGNAGPKANYSSVVNTHIKEAIRAGINDLELTLDNQGCQVAVIRRVKHLDRRPGVRVKLYTRPSSPNDEEQIKGKVLRAISDIPDQNWKPVEIYTGKEGRKRYRIKENNEELSAGTTSKQDEEGGKPPEIAETTYTLSNQKEEQNVRMVVLRKMKKKRKKGQKQMFYIPHYKPVVTNDLTSPPAVVLEKYNRRGGAEDVIGEVVEDGDADRFPCRGDAGNAVYLGASVAAHNLLKQQEWLVEKKQQMEEQRGQGDPGEGADPETAPHQKKEGAAEKKQGKKGKGKKEKQTIPAGSKQHGDPSPAAGLVCFILAFSVTMNDYIDLVKGLICTAAGGKQKASTKQKQEGEENKRGRDWTRLTPARFRNRLITVPVRVTKGGGYRHIKIQETYEWAYLFEDYVRICFNPDPIIAHARSP